MILRCLRYTSDLSKRRATPKNCSNFSKIDHARNAFSVSEKCANKQWASLIWEIWFQFFCLPEQNIYQILIYNHELHTGKKKKNLKKLPPDIISSQINWKLLMLSSSVLNSFELKSLTKKTLVKIVIAVSLEAKQGFGNSVFIVYIFKPIVQECLSKHLPRIINCFVQ